MRYGINMRGIANKPLESSYSIKKPLLIYAALIFHLLYFMNIEQLVAVIGKARYTFTP